jgi:uncharacterized membrane protein YagU involved in acid resistance
MANYAKNIQNGVIGSLAGGVLFGIMMQMMDMMPMVAMLVRSESIAVGWLVHLGISATFGVPFGLLLTWMRTNPVVTGAAWGVLAWIGGALVMMPLLLGMPGMVFNLDQNAWMSLVGHLVYGLTAGGVVLMLNRREAPAMG